MIPVGGPLDGLDPVTLAAALSRLPATHELVAAARAGVDVADLRAEAARDHADAEREIREACREDGTAYRTAEARAVWAARADAAREDAEHARTAAGDARSVGEAARHEDAADRADRWAAAAESHMGPVPPAPREPSGAQLRPEAAAVIEEARRWVEQDRAEQEEAEHSRWDYALGYDRDEDSADRDDADARSR